MDDLIHIEYAVTVRGSLIVIAVLIPSDRLNGFAKEPHTLDTLSVVDFLIIVKLRPTELFLTEAAVL